MECCAVKHKLSTWTRYALFPDWPRFALSGIGCMFESLFRGATDRDWTQKSRPSGPAFSFLSLRSPSLVRAPSEALGVRLWHRGCPS